MTVFDALAGTKVATVILFEQGLIHISQNSLISLFNYELSNMRQQTLNSKLLKPLKGIQAGRLLDGSRLKKSFQEWKQNCCFLFKLK